MVVPWALVTLGLVNGVTKLLAGTVMTVKMNRGVHIGQHFCWDNSSPISSLLIIYSKRIFCLCTLQWTLYVFFSAGEKKRQICSVQRPLQTVFSALVYAVLQSPWFKGVCLVMILFQPPGEWVLVQEKKITAPGLGIGSLDVLNDTVCVYKGFICILQLIICLLLF